jgi:hypothetical protein
VCHFPPGTSKGTKIEQRLFWHMTEHWRGKPLVSRAVCDDGDLGGGTGMQIGGGLPFFQPPVHLPPPCVSPTDPLEEGPCGWQVGQERADAFRARGPAAHQPQAQRVAVALPPPPELDPLACGECGVDGLAGLVAQRAQAWAVLATRRDNLRMPPRFGPDETAAVLVLHAPPIGQSERATIRPQHRVS